MGTLSRIVERLARSKDSLRRHRKVVVSLAALVVFVTTYSLILPAITLDDQAAQSEPGLDTGTSVQEQAAQGGAGQVSENESTTVQNDADPGNKDDGGQASETNAGSTSKDKAAEETEAGTKPDADSKVAGEKEEQLITEKTKLTFDGDGYKVVAEVGADAKLPVDTKLKVREVTKDSKDENGEKYEYKEYCEKALKAVRDQDGKEAKDQRRKVRLFDISFVSDSVNDDRILEPSDNVKVRIVFDKAIDTNDNGTARAVHFDEKYEEQTGEIKADVLKTKAEGSKKQKMKEASFESDQFSVYGVVYTVDFEYGANGETYKYSIEGNSSIKLSELFKRLNINEAVGDVVQVVFSDESLVKVTQTDDDWILNSIKPFESEEKLTITLKDGKAIVIKVTDAAISNPYLLNASTPYVIYSEVNGKICVLKTDGTTKILNDRTELDTLDNNYKWIFNYVYTEANFFSPYFGRPFYRVCPVDDSSKTLTLNYDGQDIVQSGGNQISLVPDGTGYIFEGYSDTELVNYSDGRFTTDRSNQYHSQIIIYEQEQLKQYSFNVSSDDYAMGSVAGNNDNGSWVSNAAEFDAKTLDNKKNNGAITASPQSNKYLFDYWELNGTKLDYGETIPNNSLEIPYQGSTLVAHFKRNPDWEASDEEKEGRPINKTELAAWLNELKNRQIPLNNEGCQKTSEVYDYENRIYRVDMTAQSNLSSFKGIIDLGFIIDVSSSMQFPSKLVPVQGREHVELNKINQSTSNQYWLDRNKEYYIIADKTSTATVYKLKWGKWLVKDKVPGSINGSAYQYGQYYDGWGMQDASVQGEGSFRLITLNKNFPPDDPGKSYPIYTAGDGGRTRSYYLEKSLSDTIGELKSLLGVLSIAEDSNKDPDVKIAYNTFAAEVDHNHTNHNFESVKGSIDLGYDYKGGTSTDYAVKDALDFDWQSSATKYAILITDGAPQRKKPNSSTEQIPGPEMDAKVKAQVEALKAKGVNVITVGLSMGDVKRGSVLLYDIATKDEDGDPYFYKAETGDELQYVLYEIMKHIVDKAIVEGNVTDTVGEAFYPVDKTTGKPLNNGDKIDLEGNLLSGNPDRPYGVIKESNGKYTVEWDSQEFTWDGWHGTFYQKAKEDFLGGNAVKTNDGNAVIQATGYKMESGKEAVKFKDEIKNKGRKALETPRVNVNELNFTENSNEWTVYLGTEVDPKAELKKLYENITVEEVVKGARDSNDDGFPDMITDTNHRYPLIESISDKRESEVNGNPVTFKLKDLIKNLTGSEELDWNKLIADSEKEGKDNKGITIPYHKYGLADGSYINIKLVKEVADGEQDASVSPHNTAVCGEPVEKYKLEVIYSPDYTVLPVGQGGTPVNGNDKYDYHTGQYGTKYSGAGAGTEESKNEHIINVFKKGIQIMKTDATFEKPLDGAQFELYITSDKCQTVDDVKSKKVGDPERMKVSNGHIFTKDPLPVLADGQHYYIVESTAPAGYELMKKPIEVALNVNNSYTQPPGSTKAEDKTQTKPVAGLYDWEQTATISLSGGDGVHQFKDGQDITGGAVTANADDEVYEFRVLNNPGVELPSAGGPGTTWMYLVGAILTLGAGVLLVARRRITRS